MSRSYLCLGSTRMLAIVFIFSFPFLSRAQSLKKEIDKIIRYEVGIDFESVPTLMVYTMDPHTVYIDTFGNHLTDTNRYFFELGSVTKPIVAFLATKALDSLDIDLESNVCSILPDSLCNEAWARLTIHNLLQHNAGLPKFPDRMGMIEENMSDPYQTYNVEMLAGDIKTIEPIPGKYSYSHIGYAALHWLFERVGGLENFSVKILGEHTDSTVIQGNVSDQLLIQGHGFDGKETSPWHVNAMMPALGFRTNFSSLSHFIKMYGMGLNAETPELTPELKKEFSAHQKNGSYKIVQGWFVLRSGKSIVYYHNGHTGGHNVSVAFIPAEDKAVIVLATGAAGSKELSLSILNMLKRGKHNKG